MNCKQCGQPLEEKPGGHRQREFCSDAHRVAYWRAQQQQDQAQGRTFTEMLSELTELRTKVRDQAQELAHTREVVGTLEQENNRLKKQLDVERRYLEDTGVHAFKAWLKKQPRSSAFTVQFVNDTLVPPRGSRGTYQAHVKRVWPAEMEEFTRLWKLMLLQS